MKHIKKRRAFAQRLCPIRITSLLREVADRLHTVPLPLAGQSHGTRKTESCQFPPSVLDGFFYSQEVTLCISTPTT